MHILAVDDDELVLQIVEMLLLQNDNEVTLATGADDALRLIAERDAPFDCLMLDIQMAGMDGIELCKTVRAMPGYSDCPILMLTAKSALTTVQKAFEAGASDYVTKPFEINDLTARIRMAEMAHEKLLCLKKAELARPAMPRGVTNCVGSTVFYNHIQSLSKSGRKTSWIFAVKLDGLTDLHATGGAAAAEAATSTAGRAISTELGDKAHKLSYAGEGRFVCIVEYPALLDRDALEMGIQTEFERRHIPQTAACPQPRITLGLPIRPRLTKNGGATVLIDKVLSRTEAQVRFMDVGSPVATFKRSNGRL